MTFTERQIAPVSSKVAQGTVRNNALLRDIDKRHAEMEVLLRNDESNLALDILLELRKLNKNL